MNRVLTVSLVVFKESLRNRLFAGLLVFLGLFLIFAVYISSLSLGTPARFILNTGMWGISVVCLAAAILFGLFSIYQEKDRNELFVLLNRASRPAYLLGRFLGTAYVIFLFALFTGIGVFLLTWIFGDRAAWELWRAVYWAVLEFTLLTAIGLLFYSLGVGFTLNSILVLCVYVMGHSMNEAIQSFFALGRLAGPGYFYFVQAITIIFPNLDMFDYRLSIVHQEAMPLGQAILASFYWILYLAAVMAAAAAVMKKRDV